MRQINRYEWTDEWLDGKKNGEQVGGWRDAWGMGDRDVAAKWIKVDTQVHGWTVRWGLWNQITKQLKCLHTKKGEYTQIPKDCVFHSDPMIPKEPDQLP
jgi:hypothetical protein